MGIYANAGFFKEELPLFKFTGPVSIIQIELEKRGYNFSTEIYLNIYIKDLIDVFNTLKKKDPEKYKDELDTLDKLIKAAERENTDHIDILIY